MKYNWPGSCCGAAGCRREAVVSGRLGSCQAAVAVAPSCICGKSGGVY